MFRFVHAADLHLDSPFRGLRQTQPELSKKLLKATFKAYDALIQLCIDKECQALLIAGDIFDGAARTIPGQRKFIKGLVRLSRAKIPVFICHGNHDPLDSWDASILDDIPSGVHQFGATPECVPVNPDDASSPLICGFSYPTQEVRESVLDGFPSGEPGRLTIGLLHANVGGDAGHDSYAPCTVDDLCDKGYDYWALGHVHTRAIKHDQHPTIVYPGNTQGRHINEQGARGVYVVDVDEQKHVDREFVALDVVRWAEAEVNINDIQTVLELEERLQACVGALQTGAQGRTLVFRLCLTGRGRLHSNVSNKEKREQWKEDLNGEWGARQPLMFCTDIQDQTGSSIDRELLRKGNDFPADVVEVADAYLTEDKLVAQVEAQLALLGGNSRVRRHLSGMVSNEDQARVLLNRAEEVALDLLLGDQQETD